MNIAKSPAIEELLKRDAPVAIGVSGGKDSSAVAFAVTEYLNSINHNGPRILIHSDLGRIEWRDSLPSCERLSKALSLDLIVVRRAAGDLYDRFLQRWNSNVERYAQLKCVRLILPFPAAGTMRFCTSEAKIAVICKDLVERFPGQTIISVNGIRRQESTSRAKRPIFQPQPRLTRKTTKTDGYDWHPIIDWTGDEVYRYIDDKRFPLHVAYRVYGSTRVSCAFCFLASQPDLRAAAACSENHDIYRLMVDLEIRSSFSYQSGQWLGDVAPDLLDAATRADLATAKEKARLRMEAEKRIPKHLLYTKGWPQVMPNPQEAELLSGVRRSVSLTVGIDASYVTPGSIIGRYRELMLLNEARTLKERRHPSGNGCAGASLFSV